MTEQEFTNFIKNLRAESGLSQHKFAAQLGLTGGAIYHWESGNLLNIPLGSLYKIAKMRRKTSLAKTILQATKTPFLAD